MKATNGPTASLCRAAHGAKEAAPHGMTPYGAHLTHSTLTNCVSPDNANIYAIGLRPRRTPATAEITNRISATKNTSLAASMATPATPPNRQPSRTYWSKRMLDDGRSGSVSELVTAEKLERGYLGRILMLTLLASDIVEAVLDGRQPAELGVHVR